jgi:hypothetical protein
LRYATDSDYRLGVVTLFTPDESNEGTEYVWFQTFNNNDPVDGNAKSADRGLLSTNERGNDQAAGVRKYRSQKVLALPGGPTVYPKGTDIGFLDGPNRPAVSSGTVNWNGYLTLLKKVDSKWVVVTTLQYGFEIQNKISPGNLRVNPKEGPAADQKEFHLQKIKNTSDPLLTK